MPGIAKKKLFGIKKSWQEHRAIRDVMIFLQEYGISTLFAVKIYKTYGNNAINTVLSNPYQLARDIYGIGFFSADKIALNMGFEKDGVPRIEAGIKHVLAAARDNGHCYLLESQIIKNTQEVLETGTPEQITGILLSMITTNEIKKRVLPDEKGTPCLTIDSVLKNGKTHPLCFLQCPSTHYRPLPNGGTRQPLRTPLHRNCPLLSATPNTLSGFLLSFPRLYTGVHEKLLNRNASLSRHRAVT